MASTENMENEPLMGHTEKEIMPHHGFFKNKTIADVLLNRKQLIDSFCRSDTCSRRIFVAIAVFGFAIGIVLLNKQARGFLIKSWNPALLETIINPVLNVEDLNPKVESSSHPDQYETTGNYTQIVQKLEELVSYPDEVNFKLIHKDSFVYYGSQLNLQHSIIQKVADSLRDNTTKQTFRMATFGGSMSVPYKISNTSYGYHQQFSTWLRSSLGSIGIDVFDVNSAIGATGSVFPSKCVQDLIDIEQYDLVILEHAANDGHNVKNTTAFEQMHEIHLRPLIEKLLRSNPRLQIVLITFQHPAKYPIDSDGNCHIAYSILNRVYRRIAEDYQSVVLNYQHLFCDPHFMAQLGINKDSSQEFIKTFRAKDNLHASERLHSLVRELLVNYVKRSISETLNLDSVRSMLSHEFINPVKVTDELSSFYECSMDWENMRNSHVSFDLLNSTAKSYTQKEKFRSIGLSPGLNYAVLNFSSFYGNLTNCGGSGSRPNLSVFLQTKGRKCVAIDALYQFSDGYTVFANYTLPQLDTHTFYDILPAVPRFSEYEKSSDDIQLVEGTNRLFPQNRFCTANVPKIEYLILNVHWIHGLGGFRYFGMVMEHKCC